VNLKLKATKSDLLTIALLSIIFLSIALSNLGPTQIPTSTWKTNHDQIIIIDLGKEEKVYAIYFLSKEGSATIQSYGGEPGNWNLTAQAIYTISPIQIDNPAYYVWSREILNTNTRYLQVTIASVDIEIAEIAVADHNNQKIRINSITNQNEADQKLTALTDEQNMVQLPPTATSKIIFDEVYFVRSAQQYLNGQLPIDGTHPPLGKLIIASGIAVFGFNPFGWRIMGVIFATLMIPLMYFFGKKLFGSWIGGFSAAFLLTFDFMHFTMARMGTGDTFLVFFSLASQLFFLIYLKDVLKNGWKTGVLPLFLAIIFFALAFSTKWTAILGLLPELAILAAIRARDIHRTNEKISNRILGFFKFPFWIIIVFLAYAVLIYFAVYLPDLINGRSISDLLSLQKTNVTYHMGLDTHNMSSSPWYSWPLMINPFNTLKTYVPISLGGSPLFNGSRSTIILLGNPAVWWIGFASILGIGFFGIIKIIKKFVKKIPLQTSLPAIFILTFFFAQWLPYAVMSRDTYIYYYYLSVPYLCLASTFFINRFWNYKHGKILAAAYFAVTAAMLLLFYPVISGATVPLPTINSLKWFSSWHF
jgi:dolichyl-phosphate-mannose-protein mannosyltransferase